MHLREYEPRERASLRASPAGMPNEDTIASDQIAKP